MVTVLTSLLELLSYALSLAIKHSLKPKEIKTCGRGNRVACPLPLCLHPLVLRTSRKDISSSLHFLKETRFQLFLYCWTPKAHKTVETFLLLQNLELVNVLRLLKVLALFMYKPRGETKSRSSCHDTVRVVYLVLSFYYMLFISFQLFFDHSLLRHTASFSVGSEVLTAVGCNN